MRRMFCDLCAKPIRHEHEALHLTGTLTARHGDALADRTNIDVDICERCSDLRCGCVLLTSTLVPGGVATLSVKGERA